MYTKTMRKKSLYFLLLAIIGHLLLLFTFSVSFIRSSVPFQLDQSLPAYVYKEEKYNPFPKSFKSVNNQHEETSKQGIFKAKERQSEQEITDRVSLKKGEQDINLLLKTTKKMDKPLLNLITKATADHLKYPKIAMDFRLRGTAIIGFLLEPSGQISQVTLLKSSGTKVLDDAAQNAIIQSSPIKKVDSLISEPTPLTMGIIFN